MLPKSARSATGGTEASRTPILLAYRRTIPLMLRRLAPNVLSGRQRGSRKDTR